MFKCIVEKSYLLLLSIGSDAGLCIVLQNAVQPFFCGVSVSTIISAANTVTTAAPAADAYLLIMDKC